MPVLQTLRPVRNWLAEALVDTAHRVASDDGWGRLADRLGAPNMLGGLLRLRERGFEPRAVVDIGACQGHWTRLCRRAFPQARVLMIEPQDRHRALLQQLAGASGGAVLYEQALLGPPGMASADFFVLNDPSGGTGSSILAERSDIPREVVRLAVHTLDDVVARTDLGPVSLLKADVQGFELEVLKGAPSILRTVSYVLLEVSLVQYNEGSPLLPEVLSWMESKGFSVEELFDMSRDKAGQLVQIDLLFARRQ